MDKYLELISKQTRYIYEKKLKLAQIDKDMKLVTLKKEVLFKKLRDLNTQKQKLNRQIWVIRKYENIKNNFKSGLIDDAKNMIPLGLLFIFIEILCLTIAKCSFNVFINSILFTIFLLTSYFIIGIVKNYLDLKKEALSYNEDEIKKELDLIDAKRVKITNILTQYLDPALSNLEQKSVELNDLIKQIENDKILLENERNRIIDEIVIDSELRLNLNFKIHNEGKKEMLARIRKEGV